MKRVGHDQVICLVATRKSTMFCKLKARRELKHGLAGRIGKLGEKMLENHQQQQ